MHLGELDTASHRTAINEVENGASVLSKTGYGIQAVHLAAGTGSIGIIEALFAADADLNCTDLYRRQPLHYILDFQDRPDIIKHLVKGGASIYGIHCVDGPTPLGMAFKNNFPGHLKALLSFGALSDFWNRGVS